MDHIGSWVSLSLPFFIVTYINLKPQARILTLWAYLWGLGALWAIVFLRGYHLYLAAQQMDFGPSNPETLGHYILTNWLGVGLMVVLMAVPPLLYFYDSGKMRRTPTAR